MNVNNDDLEFRERLAKAKMGDKDAFRHLILQESPAMEAFVDSRLSYQKRMVVGVDDVMQETFLSIHRDIAKADFENSRAFSSWCVRIAENRMLDLLRKSKRKKRGGEMKQVADVSDGEKNFVDELAGDETKASVKLQRKEQSDLIRDAMAELPTVQRKATELKYLDERNNKSIALLLNKSTQAVDGLLKRAKATLKNLLHRDGSS